MRRSGRIVTDNPYADEIFEADLPGGEIKIPYDGGSERFVIGSLMLNARRMRLCERARLTVDDFFLVSTREVFRVMVEHGDLHPEEFDPVSIVSYLRENGTYDRVRGHAGLGEMLDDGVPRFAGEMTFLRHVEKLREAGRKRALLL